MSYGAKGFRHIPIKGIYAEVYYNPNKRRFLAGIFENGRLIEKIKSLSKDKFSFESTIKFFEREVDPDFLKVVNTSSGREYRSPL